MCESVTTFEHLKLILCKNRPNTQVKVLLSVLFLFSPAEPLELLTGKVIFEVYTSRLRIFGFNIHLISFFFTCFWQNCNLLETKELFKITQLKNICVCVYKWLSWHFAGKSFNGSLKTNKLVYSWCKAVWVQVQGEWSPTVSNWDCCFHSYEFLCSQES